MTSKLTHELVNSKSEEIVDEIAKSTGVSSSNVKRILEHLGLGTALSNRLNVSAGRLRIAAGQVQE